ncbi:hypothetical protein [Oceanibacterium hippocampi]|uniref:Uncharacterized protein n=1 Tax=Oceanibacterium hippocampi TaxID=745714 RepID=A0A1Y5RPS0_9PROT|nr:hypothetical protein [Oceanibacterium hippocampi]SLN22605.1 hypothetical protein OCH7691_00600 [Oceanibacterium hippocampi]
MRSLRLPVGVAIIFLLSLPAVRAEAPAVSPAAGATEIVAARGGDADEWRFDVEIRDGDAPADEAELALGPDYFRLTDAARSMIVDFRLLRVIEIDRAARRFTNRSLYLFPGFGELQYFARLSKANPPGAGTGSDGAAAEVAKDPFWIEADLGIRKDAPRTDLVFADGGDGTMTVTRSGKPYATIRGEVVDLPADRRAVLFRYFRFLSELHPNVIDALEKGAALPVALDYRVLKDGDIARRQVRLRAAGRVTTPYPLDPALRPADEGHYTNDVPAIDDLVGMMAKVARGDWPTGPLSPDDYWREVERQFKDENALGTFLNVQGMAMQYGATVLDGCPKSLRKPDGCAPVLFIRDQSGTDRLLTLAIGGTRAEVEGKQEAGLKAMGIVVNEVESRDLPGGYVAQALYANMLARPTLPENGSMTLLRERQEEAFERFRKAIAGNPYIGFFYRDLGKLLFNQLRADVAWDVWDFGRLLPGSYQRHAFQTIDELEARLRADYPQFFLQP